MNNVFIKLFFSLMTLFIFFYIVSFSVFEMKNNGNKFGGIVTIIFTIGSIIYSNIFCWIN